MPNRSNSLVFQRMQQFPTTHLVLVVRNESSAHAKFATNYTSLNANGAAEGPFLHGCPFEGTCEVYYELA